MLYDVALVAGVLPGRADDLARLRLLAEGRQPVVTVIGKYNHGKSRLLNELIGQDVFAVADRRETLKLADREHRQVRWLDAPGLDADVASGDDQHALQAAWLVSDIRLFVHAAKAGELDAKELALLAELQQDALRTQRQTLFVLTQVDQFADEPEQAAVLASLALQAPGVTLHLVSAVRHRKGQEQGKTLFIERSGLPALQQTLAESLARVPQARRHEAALLDREIRAELAALRVQQEDQLAGLQSMQQNQRRQFDQGLQAVLAKTGQDIVAMLAAIDTDHALVPDSAKDAYALTAGKAERNRIQIGYSRACIALDSYLAGHGVMHLPSAQQTGSHSLNSVMIAVLGVSVKFRKDLLRMFASSAGLDRIQRKFTHYYELTEDRQALAASIAALQAALAASGAALAAMPRLGPQE